MDGWMMEYERGGADPLALECPECGHRWGGRDPPRRPSQLRPDVWLERCWRKPPP